MMIMQSDAMTTVVRYDAQQAGTVTSVPMPDEWSGFDAYRTWVHALESVITTADWTMRDAIAIARLADETALYARFCSYVDAMSDVACAA